MNGKIKRGFTEKSPDATAVLNPMRTIAMFILLNATDNEWEQHLSFGSSNLLNPTGHVIHQQFNIQQLYALLTLYLYVLYLSENKKRLVPLTA